MTKMVAAKLVGGAAAQVGAIGATISADLARVAQIEGDPFFLAGNNGASAVSVATGGVNTTITSTGGYPRVARCFYVEEAIISLDTPAIAQLNVPADSQARFAGMSPQVLLGASSPKSVTLKQPIRPVQFASGAVSIAVRNNLQAGAVNYKGTVTLVGRVITDDFNLTAPYTLLYTGNSTAAGTGPSATEKAQAFLIRDYLREQGYDCRLVLKAVGGSTSVDHDTWRKQGWHSTVVQRPNLGILDIDINDAGNGITPAVNLEKAQAFWTDWKSRYPGVPLIVIGCTPLENDTSESNAAAMRTAKADWIDAANDPLLKFVDMTGAWDRKVTSNYLGSDTAGSRVHYVDTPHAIFAGRVTAAINTHDLWPRYERSK